MNEYAKKIQIAMNTIAILNIPATFDNVNRLMGIYNLLSSVRDDLANMPERKEDPEEPEEEAGADG